MSSRKDKRQNVGDKLLGGCNTPFGVYYTPRGYEKMDVASYLVCLEGVVAGIGITTPPGVTFDTTMLYMKL